MINTETKNRQVTRGAVLVVNHEYGSPYYITALGEVMIKIEQVELIVENGKFGQLTRSALITSAISVESMTSYHKSKVLPGNIHIVEQLEPPIPDEPEECLYWLDDNTVARDKEGNAIYRYMYYSPGETWNKTGNIDDILI